MSYTKNTWATGDVITAAKMNNIENGIAAASNGGYDAELYFTYDYGNSSYEAEIISGTYSTLANLLDNNIPPYILVRFRYLNGAGSGASCTTAIPIYTYNPDASAPFIAFSAKIPESISGGTYSSEWRRIDFGWDASDEIIF